MTYLERCTRTGVFDVWGEYWTIAECHPPFLYIFQVIV